MEHKQWPARSTFDEGEIGTGDVHQTLSPFLCVACHLLDCLLVVCDFAGCPRFVSGSMPKPILTLIRETCQAGSVTREHSVILAFPVAAVGTVQTPEPGCRSPGHSAVRPGDPG